MQKLGFLLLATFIGLLPGSANAGILTYSWSGYCEDEHDAGNTNPWALAGDGDVFTPDGSKYELNIFVDSNAIDTSLEGNRAQFDISSFEFNIDGAPIQTGSGYVLFLDGANSVIYFSGIGTRLGTTLQILSYVNLPQSTFELFDDSSLDAPPLFSPSETLYSVGTGQSGSLWTYVVPGIPVTVAVPEPSLIGTMIIAAVALPMWRRLKNTQRS